MSVQLLEVGNPSLVTLEPIPVQVTRYLCPYCGRGRSRARTAKLHMERCWKNPSLRGCKTCIFFDTSGWAGGKPVTGKPRPGRCKAGFTLTKGLVTQCRKWQSSV